MLTLNLNIIYTFINLAIIYLVINRFLLKPVNEVIEKRKDLIQSTLKKAEAEKNEAQMLKNSYDKALKIVDEKGKELYDSYKTDANKERELIIEKAKEDADNIIKNASLKAKEEKAKAIRDIKSQAAEMIILATEKMAEKNIDNNDNRRIIDNFLNEAGD